MKNESILICLKTARVCAILYRLTGSSHYLLSAWHNIYLIKKLRDNEITATYKFKLVA